MKKLKQIVLNLSWTVLCLSSFLLLQAQTTQSVEVYASGTLEIVPFADVYVKQVGGKWHHHFVTDENGELNFPVPTPGNYLIEVSSIGFSDYLNKSINLPSKKLKIKLQAEAELLEDAVVTVQYERRSARNSVEKVRILDAKTLQSRSVVNLREALMHQLNVQIKQDNSTGSAMSMMGISGQNVKILVDGVPVIGRLDGNLDLSQINMNDVERIEVIEGPLSTSYGTNALAGVINIITKKTSKKEGDLSANAQYESAGQYNFGIQGGKQFGKLSLRTSGGRNFFAGWSPEETGRYSLWKPKEQYFGRVQAQFGSENTQVLLKSEGFRELLINKGRPLAPYRESAFDERFETYRLDQKAQISHKLNNNQHIQAFVAYNDYNRKRNTYFKDLITLESDQVATDGANDTTSFKSVTSRASFNHHPKTSRLQYQIGYDLLYEKAGGVRIEAGDQSIYDLAIYGSAEYRLTRSLLLKPGLRLAYNSSYQAPVVPSLSARYKLRNYVIRGSYSKGFRAPDIKELYIFFVDVNHNVQGNPELQSESSDHLLLSINGLRNVKSGFFKPEISMFYNDIRNKISLANVRSDLYTYINIDKFKSLGGKVNLSWLNEKNKFTAGFALTGLKSDITPEMYYFKEISGVATHYGKIIDLTLSMKFNGEQQIFVYDPVEASVTQLVSEQYTFLDLQLGKSFMDEKIRFQVGVKNIFDVGNINNITSVGGAHGSGVSQVPVGTGRNYFARLNISI